MKSIIKHLIAIYIIVIAVISIACLAIRCDRESEKVSYGISQEVDNFNLVRRVQLLTLGLIKQNASAWDK